MSVEVNACFCISDCFHISLYSLLIMNRSFLGIASVFFSHFLIISLLFQSTRPVQSIALSSLCRNFGHSCFGGKFIFLELKKTKSILGNWGKRELSTSSLAPDMIQSDLDINDGGTTISTVYDEYSMNNILLEQIQLVN